MRHVADQDLLLHAHRALGSVQGLRVRAHVKGCPECRTKLRELVGLSTTVASAVRSGLPGWRAPRMAFPGRLKLLLMLTGLLLLGLGGKFAYDQAHQPVFCAPLVPVSQRNVTPPPPNARGNMNLARPTRPR